PLLALYYLQRGVTLRFRASSLVIVLAALMAAFAQSGAGEQLARGRALWDQRLAQSAIAALEIAARDKDTAAEAHEALGRLYTFKGWQQESVFPGWHDEPAYRPRALAELRAAVTADPSRPSGQQALRIAEGFASAEKVDPAPLREDVKVLDARIDAYRNAAAPIADIEAAIEARA